jgi:NDP-sugar pyrophosphorylase family protein
MKALLICPWERPAVEDLGEQNSLATISLLGQTLPEYWLSHLARSGVKDVLLLADNQAPLLSEILGTGSRWGLNLRIVEESRELTPAQTMIKYEKDLDPAAANSGIYVLDHFPMAPERPLFGSYSSFLKALIDWMPHACTSDRVGVKEIQPGVYAGRNCQVSTDAKFIAPCWVGRNAFVAGGAIIGPNAVVEDGAFIDSLAAVSGSVVGANTFVGQCTDIKGSLAIGDMLIDVENAVCTRIPDHFVMCSLRKARTAEGPGWLERLAEVCVKNKAEASVLWKHFLMNRES